MDEARWSGRDLSQLSEQMQGMALNLQTYLSEQGHIKEDVTEVRRVMQSLNELLREGNLSIVTRLHLVERRLEAIENAQIRSRDWWLKILATVATSAILMAIGLLVTLYVGTKGGKP
jgi:broad specificity phosphatase PhoE